MAAATGTQLAVLLNWAFGHDLTILSLGLVLDGLFLAIIIGVLVCSPTSVYPVQSSEQ